MKLKHILLISCIVLAMFAVAAFAEVREGIFQIDVYGPENVQWNPDLNSGFNNAWYAYPQQLDSIAPPPPWWNEWFWNDPYIPGGKWVQIMFDYQLLNPDLPGQVFVTINWTNGQWVNRPTPPIPDGTYDPEIYIDRQPVFTAVPFPG